MTPSDDPEQIPDIDPFSGDWQGNGTDSAGNEFAFAAKVSHFTAVQISQDLRKALLISLCLRDHLRSIQNEVPMAAFGARVVRLIDLCIS
jgi:hypothetical protein